MGPLKNKETMTMEHYRKMILTKTAPFTDYPIIFISAVTKQRIFKAVEIAVEVYNRKNTKISTSELNNSFLPITEKTPPPSYKGKYVKIKYITQIPTWFPHLHSFVIYPNTLKIHTNVLSKINLEIYTIFMEFLFEFILEKIIKIKPLLLD